MPPRRSQDRSSLSVSRDAHAVSESAHRFNITAAIAKFIAKSQHMGINGLTVSRGLIAPDIGQ